MMPQTVFVFSGIDGYLCAYSGEGDAEIDETEYIRADIATAYRNNAKSCRERAERAEKLLAEVDEALLDACGEPADEYTIWDICAMTEPYAKEPK